DSAFASGNAPAAEARLSALASLFAGRFYVEIQRHGLPRERLVEPQLLRWAYAHSVPLVAANEAYFPKKDAFDAHDALLCIAGGPLRRGVCRAAALPGRWAKAASREGRPFGRFARGRSESRGDRQTLCLPACAAQADPAAIRSRCKRCRQCGGGGAPGASRGGS